MSLPIPLLPSAGAFKVESTIIDLGEVVLPSTINPDSESRSATSYANRPDGLSGSIFERAAAFDPINFSLSGPITDASIIAKLKQIIGLGRVRITRDFNVLGQVLFQGSQFTYNSKKIFFNPSGFTLSGDIVDWTLKERVRGSVWDFELGIQSNEYYWSGKQVTSGFNPTSVVNNGDFSVYPTIRVTGGPSTASSCTVDINGGIATFTGAIGNGEILAIDCENLTVTLDGANSLNSMNAEFYSAPPILHPGTNSTSVTIGGDATLVIEFTERHL